METILLITIVLLAIVIIVMAIKWPKVIEIEDEMPVSLDNKSKWLKLQNEGGKYIKEKDGKIYLKIVE